MNMCVVEKDISINLINQYELFLKDPHKLSHPDKVFLLCKRIFDILFSSLGLLYLSPLFVVIAILIWIKSPQGSIFFSHKRLGLNGKEFDCYKFRTMIPNADDILKIWLDDNHEFKEEFEKNFKLKEDPKIIPVIVSF